MAALTNAGETAILGYLLEGSDPLSAITDWYIALFTANPGEAGSAASEATYTGYSRVSVTRGASGWTVAGDTGDNDSAIVFGECTAGSDTVTHLGLMSASSGGTMYVYGPLDNSLAISLGITPQIAAGALDISAD